MIEGAHSPQIGWSFDGFPIYGPFGHNGAIMAHAAQGCVDDAANAVHYMCSLPLSANVLSMTVMATAMPLVGRG